VSLLERESQGSLGKPIDDARQNTAGLPESGRPSQQREGAGGRNSSRAIRRWNG